MRLPRDSGRRATSSAAHTAAPQRHAGQDALARGEQVRQLDRLLVGAGEHLVEQIAVEDLGDEARADALDAVRPGRPAREDGGRRGLDRDDARRRVVRLEHLADAGDRAAGPDAGDEDVDAAVELAQDLGAGAGRWASGLAGFENWSGRKASVARHRAGGVDGLVHPAERLDHLDARAVEAQQRLALAAHPLRQEDRQVVALGGAAEGQRDAGVARGRLDDRRAARLDAPLALGRLDHRDADAVLHRPAGIEGLELGVQLDVEALGDDPSEAHHRRATHVLGDVDRDMPPLPFGGYSAPGVLPAFRSRW